MNHLRIAARQGAAVTWLWVAAIAILAAGCSFPGSVRSTVKIGLVAPFEGPQRNAAYDLLFAARLAVQHYNLEAGTGEPLVELIALNDDGRAAESRQQAREMAVDPDIVGVIGPWSTDAALSAMDVYRAAGLASVLPDVGSASGGRAVADESDGVVKIVTSQPVDGAFVEEFRALTGHEPGAQAIQAYEGTSLLVKTVAQAAITNGRPTRADVLALIEAGTVAPLR